MLKIFKRMGRQEWTLLAASVVIIICQVYMDLRVPDYMASITRLVKTEGSGLPSIWRSGLLMLGCALMSMLLSFVSGYITAMLAAVFSRNLRGKLFDKVESFSLQEMDRFSTASLITRSTNDVAQLQNFISGGFAMMIRTPITVTIALMKITGKHWQWRAVTAGGVFIVICVVIFIIRYAHPRFRKMQTLTDELNRTMRENLTGIRVVRAYNAEAFQEAKFEEANDRLTRNHRSAQLAMSVMQPIMRLTNNALNVAIYCIGGFIIASMSGGGGDSIGTFSDMIVFSTYASKILFSFMGLNFIFMMLPRASVCAQRINEVLETPLSLKDGAGAEQSAEQKGTIEFRNVSFRYPGSEEDVITGISFTVSKGQTVAIIGATGSGKTSLINLIPRFYDPSEGEVLVDGRNVRDYRLEDLRGKIGYAPQRAVLFTGTVRSNVDYGAGTVSHNVRRAVEIAQAAEFVEKMDDGYDARIVRGGMNVSGGQRQRLSLARAVCREPEIYLFDDTFSALDYKTDRALRAALRKETAGVTTLIVAQRIGTIRDADCILVLDEGRIVGRGTHDELMASCEVYREIARTQLDEKEVS